MGVAVYKYWSNGLALQVNYVRRWSRQVSDVVISANRAEHAIRNCDRLNNTEFGVHSNDIAVDEHRIGRARCKSIRY